MAHAHAIQNGIRIQSPIIDEPDHRSNGTGLLLTMTREEPTITALPVRQPRDSYSPALVSPSKSPYRGLYSHQPQNSVSSYESAFHRRRESTLKTVMRKIFGRRRKSILEEDGRGELESDIDPEKRAASSPPDHHAQFRSSPSVGDHRRPASVSRPSSASSERRGTRSVQETRIPVQQHRTIRRRATLPSLILSDDGEARETAMSVVSPLSATTERSLSEVSPEDAQSHEEVTSPRSLSAHRRSRSADALHDMSHKHCMSPIQWSRPNGDVKKKWQSDAIEEDDRSPTATWSGEAGTGEQPTTTMATTTSSSSDDKPPPESDDSNLPQVMEPEGRVFNIENLVGTLTDPDATVEERLTTLEVKLMDLELAIARIQGTVNDDFPRPTPPGTRTPAKGKSPETQPPLPSLMLEPSSAFSETSSQSDAASSDETRPVSMATLRPNINSPYSQQPQQQPPWQMGPSSSTSNLHGISIEQYSALVTLIRREQTARKALESQILLLQDEVRSLRQAQQSAGGYYPVSPPGTLYPIPCPESDEYQDSSRHRRRQAGSSRREARTASGSEEAEPWSREGSYLRSMS